MAARNKYQKQADKSRKAGLNSPKARGKSAPKRGRPTDAERLRKAVEAFGIDPDAIDPRRVLASIAIDKKVSATARVAAAKALIVSTPAPPPAGDEDVTKRELPARSIPNDELSRRAIAMLDGRKPH